MYRLNISYKQFYITLNKIWLYESDPNAPSTSREPGGKQWQHSIWGCNYNNQLPVVLQYFTNIAAIQNVVVLQPIWLRNHWGYIIDVSKYHNAGIWGILRFLSKDIVKSSIEGHRPLQA